MFSLVLLKFHNYSGCDDSPKKESKTTTAKSSESIPGYELSEPRKIDLIKDLDEISGIAFYPKDTSVFAINDQEGVLYKIYLNRSNKTSYWKFDQKHDFEDLVLHDSAFYVLISNGNIDKLKYTKDTLSRKVASFSVGNGKINEFESLYFDDSSKQLVMICNNCEADKKKSVSSFSVSTDSLLYKPGFYSIDVAPIIEKLNLEKIHLKPSAAAINPVTDDLYILAATNRLLVVTDRAGVVKNVYPLDPEVFRQPEALAFSPLGDMIIANEAGEGEAANLLIFKYQKEE